MHVVAIQNPRPVHPTALLALVLISSGCTGDILGTAGGDTPGSGAGGSGKGGVAGTDFPGSGGKGGGDLAGAPNAGGDGNLGGAASLCPSFAARCDGRACGNDGFDGSCGTCPAGQHCSLDGQCEACTPSCDGKQCGDDGCGNTCGPARATSSA